MKFGVFVLDDFFGFDFQQSVSADFYLSRQTSDTKTQKMAATSTPNVMWAQRKETLYLCIDLQDVKEEKITLEATKLNFKGKSQGKNYEITIEFFDEVNPQGKVDICSYLALNSFRTPNTRYAQGLSNLLSKRRKMDHTGTD